MGALARRHFAHKEVPEALKRPRKWNDARLRALRLCKKMHQTDAEGVHI
jgi:hypothetical protein